MEEIYAVGGAKYKEMKACFEKGGEGYVDPEENLQIRSPIGLLNQVPCQIRMTGPAGCPIGEMGHQGPIGLVGVHGDTGCGCCKNKVEPLVQPQPKKKESQPWKLLNKQSQIKNRRFKNR